MKHITDLEKPIMEPFQLKIYNEDLGMYAQIPELKNL